jgi:hypothetical protein
MEDNVDLLDQESSLVGFNTQLWQHAVTSNGDNFMTKLGMFAFYLIKELKKHHEICQE